MKYFKKVCQIKEYRAGFSSVGDTLSGMIKCEQNGSKIKLELSVLNLAPPNDTKYLLFIGNSQKNCLFTLNSGFCNFYTSEELLDLSYPFAVMILLENSSSPIAFGKTLDYEYSLKEFLKIYKEKSATLFLEEQQDEKEIVKGLLYSNDVVATENYYDNADVDLENLTLKDNDEKLKNDSTYQQNNPKEKEQEDADDSAKDEQDFCSIQKEILSCNAQNCPSLLEFVSTVPDQENFSFDEDVENLLNSYPKFAELENAIYGSRWVTISLEDCEYYFGRATIGSEAYLCYAVKGEDGCCPNELKELATFIPSPYSQNFGYYVMFQKEK